MRRAILSFIVAVVFAGTASAERLQESFDRTVDVRPGASVSLENVNGRIVVSSWDQPRVRIHAVRKAESREVLDNVVVDVRGGGGGDLSIVSKMPGRKEGGLIDLLFGDGGNASVDYELTVPRTADVKVGNTNGSITLTEVSGRIELSTTNGRIEAVRCSGTINASTTNGSIRAELLQVSSGKAMEFETTNGSI
ncbi:MAG: hypothetical protein ACXW2Q_07110, partial [Thermoanaerobaculia bacterium]